MLLIDQRFPHNLKLTALIRHYVESKVHNDNIEEEDEAQDLSEAWKTTCAIFVNFGIDEIRTKHEGKNRTRPHKLDFFNLEIFLLSFV